MARSCSWRRAIVSQVRGSVRYGERLPRLFTCHGTWEYGLLRGCTKPHLSKQLTGALWICGCCRLSRLHVLGAARGHHQRPRPGYNNKGLQADRPREHYGCGHQQQQSLSARVREENVRRSPREGVWALGNALQGVGHGARGGGLQAVRAGGPGWAYGVWASSSDKGCPGVCVTL